MSSYEEESRLRNEAIDQRLKELGVKFEFRFSPQNIDLDKVLRDAEFRRSLQIKWNVKVSRGNRELETPYSTGLGWHPFVTDKNLRKQMQERMGPNFALQEQYWHAVVSSLSTGDYVGSMFWEGTAKPLPKPKGRDVMYSLLLDGSGDMLDFESWAQEYGYDTDSRKAYATWEACRSIAAQMQRMFNSAELEELRKLYEGY